MLSGSFSDLVFGSWDLTKKLLAERSEVCYDSFTTIVQTLILGKAMMS